MSIHTDFELDTIKNEYSGRIFLIGNGPSLKETPLELLQDEYTFAANSISDIFSETEWRPSFYACVDEGVDQIYYKKCMDIGIPCFFPKKTTKGNPLIKPTQTKENVALFKHIDLKNKEDVDISTFNVNYDTIESYQDVWSKDITEVVYGYNTIMYHMMQISYYMGFDEFYLVGNDLYDVFDKYLLFPEATDPAMNQLTHESILHRSYEFIKSSDYPIKSFCNGVTYKAIKSKPFNTINSVFSTYDYLFDQSNYFSEEYSNKVVTPEKNRRHIVAHELAKSVSNELNFNIFNSTVGGNLEVYSRRNIRDIVE